MKYRKLKLLTEPKNLIGFYCRQFLQVYETLQIIKLSGFQLTSSRPFPYQQAHLLFEFLPKFIVKMCAAMPHNAITAHPKYNNQTISLEELRYADYQLSAKAPKYCFSPSILSHPVFVGTANSQLHHVVFRVW